MQNITTALTAPTTTLVVGPSWIGDMVMAQSLFKVIKARPVEQKITVLAPKWSESVLQRMPEVDHTIEMTVGHGSLHLRARRKLAKQIGLTGFDQAIVLPGSFKSGLIPWFAGIPRRTGFVGEQRWGLLNDVRVLDKQNMPLNVQSYVSLAMEKSDLKNLKTDSSNIVGLANTNLNGNGVKELLERPPYPELVINHRQRDQALIRFGLKLTQPVMALCPGAEYGPAKRWPADHYANVARKKIADGWQVWLFGSDKDAPIGEQINALNDGQCVNLCGETTLGEAIDLMSCAKYAVTNDSGLMHIAAAVGCHVIAIYGSSSDQFTPPLTGRCDRLNLNLSCSPCFKRECPLGHLNCLKQLEPERVLKSIV